MDLSVETATQEDHVVVTVKGELDMATSPSLRDHLLATLNHTDHLTLDLTGVNFMDSTGLQALVATRRRANLCGDRFCVLVAPGGPVERLLELTGLDEAFVLERR